MDTKTAKLRDEQVESYAITSVKDVDAGYTMTFEGTEYVYWIPKKMCEGFIPKPNDIAVIYGQLSGEKISEKTGKTKEGKDQFVVYHKTNNELVRGLEIIRVKIDKSTKLERREKVELFYAPAKAEPVTAKKSA